MIESRLEHEQTSNAGAAYHRLRVDCCPWGVDEEVL
jgi:hypothetical protein